MDFYSLLILICPDFPKNLLKKINTIYQMIYEYNNSGISFNLENKILPFEFFVVFSLYYLNIEFFLSVERIFKIENFFSNVNKYIENIPSVEVIDLCVLVNHLNNVMSEEIFFEILISCDEKMLNEYNLNGITFIEEAKEIIEKFSTNSNKKKGEVNFTSSNYSKNEVNLGFLKFYERLFKNYNFIYDFFVSFDDYAYDIKNFLMRLE